MENFLSACKIGRYIANFLLLAAVISMVGCSVNLPQIRVKSPNILTSAEPLPEIPVLGAITASDAQYEKYSGYVRDYLFKQLEKKELLYKRQATDPAEEPNETRQILSGQIDFSSVANPTDNSKTALEIQIKFNLGDKSNSFVHSITLSGIIEQIDQPGIESALRYYVDSYLDMIFPPRPKVAIAMARGFSKFDRQGRELARQGDYAGALEKFRQAIDAKPYDHAALYNAALVCEALGEYENGLQYYRRAWQLKQRPEYKKAIERVEGLLYGPQGAPPPQK